MTILFTQEERKYFIRKEGNLTFRVRSLPLLQAERWITHNILPSIKRCFSILHSAKLKYINIMSCVLVESKRNIHELKRPYWVFHQA